MVYSAVFAACCMDGSGFKRRTSSNACGQVCKYVNQKDLVAMLTSIQSAGVAPEVNLRITQASKHAKKDPPWLWNPGQTSCPKQGYQWPHKKDLRPPKKNFKNRPVADPGFPRRKRTSAQARKHASKKSTLALKPRADAPEVRNRGISGPTKRTRVLQKFKKKKKEGRNFGPEGDGACPLRPLDLPKK